MKKNSKKEECLRTFTGKKFHIFNPKENEVYIKDIAHSLSMTCRFNGHSSVFYSVASHLIIGSKLIKNPFKKEFFGHDFSEAFTGDLISPIKRRSNEFCKMEKKVEKIIAKKYNFSYPMLKEVKEMDNLMFRMELCYLMNYKTKEIFPITKKDFIIMINKTPAQVKVEFMERFNELTKN